jgi:hypothetical protein
MMVFYVRFAGNRIVVIGYVELSLTWFGGIIFESLYILALRYSHRGRGTFLLQPKKVPKKGRHHGYAPAKRRRGSHLGACMIMLRQNSQKTLRHAGTENS